MEQMLANIDQRIAQIDERIAGGKGNATMLQKRRENLLKRKESVQNGGGEEGGAGLGGGLGLGLGGGNNLDALKRQRDNIQSRLDRINGKITTLES